MILASIEGTIGAAVLALLMLAIRWIGNRAAAEKPAGETVEKHRPRKSAAALGAKSDSEEERMRRFLEALGIPTDGVEERRPATPPPLRPAQRREPSVKPVPPIVAKSSPPRRVPPAVQRPAPPPIPKIEPRPEIKAPQVEVQGVELRSHEGLEFETTTSRTSAAPSETDRSHGTTLNAISEQSEASGRELWRAALQSPEGLRSAFILREILGPPRGLQSNGIVPSFPSS